MTETYLTCLCGAIKTPFKSPLASAPPFSTTLCHCNPCRYATGALYAEFPRITESPPQEILNACTRYDALGPGGIHRYFCTRCGTHVFGFDARDGQWHGLGGAIEHHSSEPVADLVRVTEHIFVDDTVDGGVVAARPALTKLRYGSEESKEILCYARYTDEGSLPYESVQHMAAKLQTDDKSIAQLEGDNLVVRCHCGGTDVRIKRADYSKDAPSLPANRVPQEPDKYYAFFCPCRSCRLAFGVTSLAPWAAVPTANITEAHSGERVVLGLKGSEPGANRGTSLKHYWSSKAVSWSFCGTCGAVMFYSGKDEPTSVDVAVGVMRAPEGAFANNWLSWREDGVNFQDEAVDNEILKALLVT